MNSVIQWFPGHMAKTKREISEKIKYVDLVIEIKDARIPFSSTNPLIDEIIGNKPRLILLCKAGIADSKVTEKWMQSYKNQNILSLDVDSVTGYNINQIVKYSHLALKEHFAIREKKGIISKQIKAVIIGIPNVGKSTLINKLANRKATAVGDKPGVTKNQTWIKVSADMHLLDTSGILWPKFEDQQVGINLAICGSIKDEILDLERICLEAIKSLKKNYPTLLMKRYNLESLAEDPLEIIEQIAKIRGCLLKAGLYDFDKAAKLIINDIRTTKIGAISFERP